MSLNTPAPKNVVDRSHFLRLVSTEKKVSSDTQRKRALSTNVVKDSREQELDQVACRSMN